MFSHTLEHQHLRSSPTRGAPEPGGAGGLCVLHQGRAPLVSSPVPAGRLPAAGLLRPPHALPGRGRAGAGAVLPDPGGAAGQPGEQQKDLDPVSCFSSLFFMKLHGSSEGSDPG